MFEHITICPHCKEETKILFDIVNEDIKEGYENTCSQCDKEFVFYITGSTQKD